MSLLSEELLWLAEVGGQLRFYSDEENQQGCVVEALRPEQGARKIQALPQWPADLTVETRLAAIENELPYWIGAVRRVYEGE